MNYGDSRAVITKVSAVFSLKGKVALVTGAGSANGIGIACAKALQELGAQVVITSSSDRVLKRGSEIGVAAYTADLTNETEVAELLSKIPALDILVNNAGMTSVGAPATPDEATDLSNVSLESWRQGVARNLDLTFLVTKYGLPKLRAAKNGRIIMVSSVTGAVMAMKNQPVYAAAKAGMVGLTKAIALDEAKNGITCNAVLPGWIATESISDAEKANGASVPMGRGGTPEEIAALVCWLATDEASYITGQAIVVDGGNSIMEERS
jgi:3-oxoacyl-[acyl-carrier protein] reductase